MSYLPGTYRIYNAHTHIFPDKLAQKASRAIGDFYELEMNFPGDTGTLLRDGATIGTLKYLVCSTATTPGQVKSINDFIHAQCLAHAEFIGFATVHPALDDILEETERAAALGLKGIKLHPDFQRFDIDDPAAIPIYRAAAKLGLPVLFHMGDNRYDYSAPVRLRRVADMVPGLVCIGAHFGGYRRWDDAVQYLKHENIYFDTSSSLFYLDRQKAVDMIGYFGEDRFFFGTDFPMWNSGEEIERFLSLGLSRRQNEKILSENFAKMLHISI